MSQFRLNVALLLKNVHLPIHFRMTVVPILNILQLFLKYMSSLFESGLRSGVSLFE